MESWKVGDLTDLTEEQLRKIYFHQQYVRHGGNYHDMANAMDVCLKTIYNRLRSFGKPVGK